MITKDQIAKYWTSEPEARRIAYLDYEIMCLREDRLEMEDEGDYDEDACGDDCEECGPIVGPTQKRFMAQVGFLFSKKSA